MGIFTFNNSKSGKRYMKNSTNLVNEEFSLRDPFSLLQDENVWKMEEEEYEEEGRVEDGEIREEYDHRKNGKAYTITNGMERRTNWFIN